MNFELKTLSWAQAAALPSSLLVVLVTKSASAGANAPDGPVASLVAAALAAGDCDGSAGRQACTSLPALRSEERRVGKEC